MKYLKKTCAITLSAAMVMSLAAGAGNVSYAAENIEKEETVYVNQTADGTVDSVTVSDWLKNVTGTGDVSDVSNLKDIKNVKGDETFTQESDGKLTWKAENADIYYQGTTDEKPPVGVKVSYQLDGVDTKPADMAGKSGEVTITIHYENNADFEDEINGKKTEMKTPFLMASAVILPVDTFSEVTVSQGKLVSEGSNQILVAYGMPGLSDSLELSNDLKKELDEKLSDTVIITAKVTDFSMGSIYTVATSDEFKDIDLDDNSDFDDLENAVNDLADATDELLSGSTDLSDGLTTLQDSFKTYASGVNDVSTGASDLSSGASKLSKGVTQYTSGVTSLANGASQYVAGTNQLTSGVSTYVAGEKQVDEGVSQLYEASKDFPAQYDQFHNSLNTYVNTVNGLPETIGEQVKSSVGNIVAAYNSQLSSVPTQTVDMSAVETALNATGLTADEKTAVLNAAKTAAENAVVKQKQADMYAVSAVGQNIAASGVDFSTSFAPLKEAGSQLVTASGNQIKPGIVSVTGGIKSIYDGVKQLSSGNEALLSGADALTKSGTSLTSGIATLNASTKTLTSSASKLSKGATKLSKGASELNGATKDVSSGVNELQSGSVELVDGMNEFKSEGTGKLQREYNNNVKTVIDRFQSLTKGAEEYKTFSGIADEMNGTVKFIFQTEEITTEEE
ncbi:MAG: hypothetical protein ACI4A3_02895 [Lachnospiraceae bacterium]